MKHIDGARQSSIDVPADRSAWEAEGRLHALRVQKSLWEVAWWLVEGQQRAFDPGFEYAQSVLQRDRTTIENYYRVGLAWPRGKNHPDLSFSAHRELLREPDANARALVLSMAIERGWFANDITRYFAEYPPTHRVRVGEGEGQKPSRDPKRTPYVARKRDVYVGAHVKCPCGCEHVFPIRGHKVSGPLPQKEPTS